MLRNRWLRDARYLVRHRSLELDVSERKHKLTVETFKNFTVTKYIQR